MIVLIKRLLLLSIFALSLLGSHALAAPTYSDNTASLLNELKIMQGAPDGNMRYNDLVSRAECAKIAVASSPHRNSVALGAKTSPFKDVKYTHWAAPYVTVGIKNGLFTGYLDATFRPSNTVLYEEAITMFLRVLGYTNEDFGASWPDGQVGIARNIGILDNVEKNVGDALTRRDVATIAYNTLNAKQKNSQSIYLSTFNRTIVDDVVLISTTNEDPSIAEGKIFTSSGTYNYESSLDLSNIGLRGSLVLRNNDTVVAFIGDNRNKPTEKQMVYSVLGGGIVTYKNGSFSQVEVDNSTVFYKNSTRVDASSALASLEMGDVVRISYAQNGEIDYILCTSGTTVGPKTVASADWYNSFGASSSVTVMKDGVKASVAEVSTYDIAYYLKELDIALVYSKKVTGIYEDASPNKDTPTTITVSGESYKLEGLNAFSKLSSNGVFNFGDTVTLLLGKNGDVADVLTSSQASTTVCGYLSDVGTKETIVSGTKVTKNYIELTLPSGEVCEYITSKDYSSMKNAIVSVTLKNGTAAVSRLSQNNDLHGSFVWSTSSKSLGGTPLSDNIKILEVSTTQSDETGMCATVYPQRLHSQKLSSGSILYFRKNASGEIDELILKDVTGDMHTYGIITSAQSNNNTNSGSYTYISNGTEQSIFTQNKIFGVHSSQAVKIISDGREVSSIFALNKVPSGKITSINGSTITLGNSTYTLSQNVQIYIKKTYSSYDMITLDELQSSYWDYSPEVYMDKVDTSGRVRIIILSK